MSAGVGCVGFVDFGDSLEQKKYFVYLMVPTNN